MTQPASTPQSAPTLGSLGLTVLLSGQLLLMIDFSIVNVALDAISHTFSASPTALALMVSLYGVALAVCLAMGGRLGDRYGRRRLFACGVALFGLASLLCGLAHSLWLLTAARALQGVAAALIVPQVLATIHVCLSGRAHSRAISLYSAIGGMAFIVGQVLGGFLVSANIAGSGWRSVFLINLPLCLAVLASLGHLPETRSPRASRIDWPGTVLLAAVIVCLLLPLALGPALHWPWPCVALLAAVAPLLALLWQVELWQERRGMAPLLPPELLRVASVRFSLLLAGLFFACWSGFMFVVALTVQAGARLSPAQSGQAFVALGAAYFVSSLLSARVVARLGKTLCLLAGCAIQMTGLLALMATFHLVWPQPSIASLIPATVLIGFGQAFIVGCVFRIGLADIPTALAGAGGAMLSTVMQAALGLGPAFMGAVFAQRLAASQDYLAAVTASLLLEFCLMALLVGCTLAYRARNCKAPGVPAKCPA